MTDMIRMYVCHDCGYKTERKDAYVRHQNSKKHLKNALDKTHHNSENVGSLSKNVVSNSKNVVSNSKNVVSDSENVVSNSENVVSNSENVAHYNCKKCSKRYKKKESLDNHEKTCTGVDCLTCPRCMKTFADRHTKCKHCKRNTCKPVSIFEAENVKSIISHSYNNNTNSLNTNNTNITNITNVYVNDYGKERKDYLLAYDNFFDIIRIPNNNILVKYLKCKNFNPLFPENHCIKYENRCFKLKENNKWRLINPTALKDKLYYDCGSEVLHVFDTNEERIRKQIQNDDHFEAVKKKSNFMQLEMQDLDTEIKNSMLDVVKDK
jgi:hypothetical protein